MVHDLLSPRGVTDVFVLDGSVSKLEFNSSFRKEDSKLAKKRHQQQEREKEKESKGNEIQKQLQEIQDRMKWLQEQAVRDKQDFQERLKKAKKECREQLERDFAPTMENNARNDMGKSVVEKQKIIQNLRDGNSRLRQEIVLYKKETAALLQSNAQLEKTNARMDAANKELADHVAGLEAVHAKLEKNCRIFKEALQDMKDEYKRRDAHYRAEIRSGKAYEAAMVKILAHIKNKSTNPALIEQTFEVAGEGVTEASQCRDDELSKLGLIRETKSFDVMSFMDEKKKKNIHDDSESDTDSDSDDE